MEICHRHTDGSKAIKIVNPTLDGECRIRWGKFKNIVESQEPAGINVLQPDSEDCTMTGVDGGIKVSATGSHMVTVHDIHGRSIRQVLVADGSQLIELPAGFYIVTTDGAAAQKLLVR